MTRVAVVGGGIAGLTLAHRLARDGRVAVSVLERAGRSGGHIRTEEADGFRFEWGPNGFLDDAPETLALVGALGLEDRLLPSRDEARRRYIFRAGRLHRVPGGPVSLLRSRLLSWPGKARLALEPWARPRPEGEETIDAFATRRIGAEAAAVFVGPMVTGVFAGDPRQLSLAACFPRLLALETEHGGLVRALLALGRRRRAGGTPRPSPLGRLTSFRDGTEELVRALARALGPSLRTAAAVRALLARTADRDGSARYRLELADGSLVAADAVVLAGPAGESARLLEGTDAAAAALLREIPAVPVGVIGLGYEASSLPRALDGFGFLVPRGEGPKLLGVLWESSIFPGRAPEGAVLLRAMVGGASDPEALDLPDDALLARVRAGLLTTLGLVAPPRFVRIVRHRAGIPQYTVGHLARLDRLERRLADDHPGLFLAGSSYRGVALNACIAEAVPLAERILAWSASRDRGTCAPGRATA